MSRVQYDRFFHAMRRHQMPNVEFRRAIWAFQISCFVPIEQNKCNFPSYRTFLSVFLISLVSIYHFKMYFRRGESKSIFSFSFFSAFLLVTVQNSAPMCWMCLRIHMLKTEISSFISSSKTTSPTHNRPHIQRIEYNDSSLFILILRHHTHDHSLKFTRSREKEEEINKNELMLSVWSLG